MTLHPTRMERSLVLVPSNVALKLTPQHRRLMSVSAGYLFPFALLLVPECCAVAHARPAASRFRPLVDSLAHAYLDVGHSPRPSIAVVRGQGTLARPRYCFVAL